VLAVQKWREYTMKTALIKHYAEHAVVAAMGFVLGVVIAMSVIPGDTLLVLVTGVVFGFFSGALFNQGFGGDWFWPFGRPVGRRDQGAKTNADRR
jgi:hypothetical protein